MLPDTNPGAFGIVVGFKVQLYLTAILVLLPTGVLEHYILMHVILFITLAVFYGTSKSDPGLIPRNTSIQEAHRVSVSHYCTDNFLFDTVLHNACRCL